VYTWVGLDPVAVDEFDVIGEIRKMQAYKMKKISKLRILNF